MHQVNLSPSEQLTGICQFPPSIIGHDLIIDGSLISTGGIHIEGRVIGNLQAEEISVGPGALVEGNVCSKSLMVRGRITGNVSAYKTFLSSTSFLKGIVATNLLCVELGAIVDGAFRRLLDLKLGHHAPAPQSHRASDDDRVRASSFAALDRASQILEVAE